MLIFGLEKAEIQKKNKSENSYFVRRVKCENFIMNLQSAQTHVMSLLQYELISHGLSPILIEA